MPSAGSQALIRFVPETTFDSTPAAGTWETLRFTGENLKGMPNTSETGEIISNRQLTDEILDSVEIAGDINFELSYGTFDALFESVFYAAWSTNVLKIGTTRKSFTFEKEFTDFASGNEFVQFKGVIADGLTLTFPGSGAKRVTGTFNMLGATALAPVTTSLVGGGSTTAATTTNVMTGGSNFTMDQIDSTALPAGMCITQLALNLQNQNTAVECLGQNDPSDYTAGRLMCTLTIDSLVDPNTIEWVADSLNRTAKQIKWTVSDGTSSYAFEIGTSKWTVGHPAIEDEGPIPIQATAKGLYDATDLSTIVLTRTP